MGIPLRGWRLHSVQDGRIHSPPNWQARGRRVADARCADRRETSYCPTAQRRGLHRILSADILHGEVRGYIRANSQDVILPGFKGEKYLKNRASASIPAALISRVSHRQHLRKTFFCPRKSELSIDAPAHKPRDFDGVSLPRITSSTAPCTRAQRDTSYSTFAA